MKRRFTEKLMATDRNKAPGSDGFTFKFAQIFWMDLKRELLSLFTQFFKKVEFDQCFSSSFISLTLNLEAHPI